MSNTALLTTGYVAVVVLYGLYWATLRMRVARLAKKARG